MKTKAISILKTVRKQEGQALITFLFFVLIGVTVIASSVAVLYANSLSTSTSEQGQIAYYYAESGIEDGVLRLIRNPSYTSSGYSALSSSEPGTATVTVTYSASTNTDTITSVGVMGKAIRTIQAQAQFVNGKLTLQTWKEQ